MGRKSLFVSSFGGGAPSKGRRRGAPRDANGFRDTPRTNGSTRETGDNDPCGNNCRPGGNCPCSGNNKGAGGNDSGTGNDGGNCSDKGGNCCNSGNTCHPDSACDKGGDCICCKGSNRPPGGPISGGPSGRGGNNIVTLVVTIIIYITLNIANVTISLDGGSNTGGRADRGTSTSDSAIAVGRAPATSSASGDNDLATTNICSGVGSDSINVLMCSSDHSSSTSNRNSNMVINRSDDGRCACVVAYTRMVSNNNSIEIRLSSRARCSTAMIKCSSGASVKILGVGTANLGTTRFNSDSGLSMNRAICTVNGPNKATFTNSFAGNVMSTVSHPMGDRVNCRVVYVRRATTVGPNGSNNTLIGRCNRMVNVGSSGVTDASCRKVTFSMPDIATGRICSRVITGNCIAGEPGLKVACSPTSSDRVCDVVMDLGRLPTKSLVIRDIRSSSDLTSRSMGRNSLVAGIGNGSLSDTSSLPSLVSGSTINSALALAVYEVSDGCGVGRFRMGTALIRSGNSSSSMGARSAAHDGSCGPFDTCNCNG